MKILSIAGNKFKDLNRNGKLDRYEDWRLTAEERARDLASKLSVDQIAGLMLYSRHQALPAPAFGFMGGTYQGKNYQEGLVSPWALTDQQREFLEKDGLRHVLLTAVKDPETAARWNNELQGFVEGLGWGFRRIIVPTHVIMLLSVQSSTLGQGGKFRCGRMGLRWRRHSIQLSSNVLGK